jgi:hypothetical protein
MVSSAAKMGVVELPLGSGRKRMPERAPRSANEMRSLLRQKAIC